jgi:beta-fructofuranosidase
MKRLEARIIAVAIATLLSTITATVSADDNAMHKSAVAAVRAAIPKAESDPTRPVYHFRPPAQWMNDICGAIYYSGYYHAFYQYNPFSGDRWGANYSLWGHARSADLVHWENLPWALLPLTDRGERRCNSGCVTLDGNGRPMIFYTFVPARKDATRLGKREHWAASPLDDELVQWRRVKNEPLMAAGMNGVPEDVNGGWSDPFVFKSSGRTFVTFKSCDGLVCEARDKELTQWQYAGRMAGVSGECPNFFPLQDKWVLIRSTQPISYVLGEFDAETIAFETSGSASVLDYGFGKNPPRDRSWTRGLYGTNAFTDKNGRRILLGWICGFKPKRGWNGCMSLPRVLTLDKDQRLIQTPAPGLEKLRGKHVEIKDLSVKSAEKKLDAVRGDTLEIVADFAVADAEAFGLRVRRSADGNSAITMRYAKGSLKVGGTEVPLKLATRSKTLTLHVFIDKSVLEVFVNEGVTSVTRVEYPGEEDLGVSVFAENGSVTLKSLNAWKMKSIW